MEFSITSLIPPIWPDKYFFLYGLKKWSSIEIKCIFFNYGISHRSTLTSFLKTSLIKSEIDYVFSLRNKLHVQAIFTVTNNLGKFKRELRKMNQIIPVFLKKY